MNLVTNWFSNNGRPKDTIGRILASAPPGTIEITQTKKPKSLLTPWITREKELKIVFRSEDSTTTPSNAAVLSTKSLSSTTSAPAKSSALMKSSASTKISKRAKSTRASKKPTRPAITSAPPSYDTAIATKQGNSEGTGMVQAGVMSGVGMAALYCAKMAWEIYSTSTSETKGEEEEEEEVEEKKKLGWLGV